MLLFCFANTEKKCFVSFRELCLSALCSCRVPEAVSLIARTVEDNCGKKKQKVKLKNKQRKDFKTIITKKL